MTKEFEPMLAATLTPEWLDRLGWPMLVSAKIDGYRCVVRDGVALTRNLKPIVNEFIQSILGRREFNGLDGELTVGPPWGENVIGRTASGVKRRNGEPDFNFFIFDDFSAHGHNFNYRIGRVEDRVFDAQKFHQVKLVEHEILHSSDDLLNFESLKLGQGYEGVMLRSLDGKYKFGRATEIEGTLWKLKRFVDAEAVVLSLEQGQINENVASVNALGRTQRSTLKNGMVSSGMVGTLLSVDVKTRARLRISPGCMTVAQRKHYWEHPEELIQKCVTYKKFEYGTKDMDRFSLFKMVRDPADLPPEVRLLLPPLMKLAV